MLLCPTPLYAFLYVQAPCSLHIRSPTDYQLAFLIPGISPCRASILKGNCIVRSPLATLCPAIQIPVSRTHPGHSKIFQNSPTFASFYASVVDLRKPRVTVHLGQLELRSCTGSLREGRVADYVAEGLSLAEGSGQQGCVLEPQWRSIASNLEESPVT